MYIYGLCEPGFGGAIRYIGATKNVERRYNRHISWLKTGHHVHHWIASLKSKSLLPEVFVIEECDENTWRESERFWISYFRYIGADLTNIAIGGEGGTPSRFFRNASLAKKGTTNAISKRA